MHPAGFQTNWITGQTCTNVPKHVHSAHKTKLIATQRLYSKLRHTKFIFGGLLYFRVLSPMAIEISKIDIETNKQGYRGETTWFGYSQQRNNSISSKL